MKRALIVLLMLAVMAGGLFADITFSGSANTGAAVFIGDDVNLLLNNPDAGTPWRFTVNATGTNASGNAGANGYFRRDAGGAATGNGNVWFKPLDILTVRAGNDPYGWGFGTPGNAGAHPGHGTGIQFQLDPMAGVNVYAGIMPKGKIADTAFGLGLKYSDLLTLVANLAYSPDAVDAGVGAGFDIGSISLAVDAAVYNLAKLSTAGELEVGPQVDFSLGALSAGLGANLFIPVAGQKLGIKVGASASYPVTDSIKFNLGVGYSMNQALGAVGEDGSFDYRTDGVPAGYATSAASSVLGVHPNLEIGLSAGGTIVLGYGFATHIGGESAMRNAVYARYGVSF